MDNWHVISSGLTFELVSVEIELKKGQLLPEPSLSGGLVYLQSIQTAEIFCSYRLVAEGEPQIIKTQIPVTDELRAYILDYVTQGVDTSLVGVGERVTP